MPIKWPRRLSAAAAAARQEETDRLKAACGAGTGEFQQRQQTLLAKAQQQIERLRATRNAEDGTQHQEKLLVEAQQEIDRLKGGLAGEGGAEDRRTLVWKVQALQGQVTEAEAKAGLEEDKSRRLTEELAAARATISGLTQQVEELQAKLVQERAALDLGGRAARQLEVRGRAEKQEATKREAALAQELEEKQGQLMEALTELQDASGKLETGKRTIAELNGRVETAAAEARQVAAVLAGREGQLGELSAELAAMRGSAAVATQFNTEAMASPRRELATPGLAHGEAAGRDFQVALLGEKEREAGLPSQLGETRVGEAQPGEALGTPAPVESPVDTVSKFLVSVPSHEGKEQKREEKQLHDQEQGQGQRQTQEHDTVRAMSAEAAEEGARCQPGEGASGTSTSPSAKQAPLAEEAICLEVQSQAVQVDKAQLAESERQLHGQLAAAEAQLGVQREAFEQVRCDRDRLSSELALALKGSPLGRENLQGRARPQGKISSQGTDSSRDRAQAAPERASFETMEGEARAEAVAEAKAARERAAVLERELRAAEGALEAWQAESARAGEEMAALRGEARRAREAGFREGKLRGEREGRRARSVAGASSSGAGTGTAAAGAAAAVAGSGGVDTDVDVPAGAPAGLAGGGGGHEERVEQGGKGGAGGGEGEWAGDNEREDGAGDALELERQLASVQEELCQYVERCDSLVRTNVRLQKKVDYLQARSRATLASATKSSSCATPVSNLLGQPRPLNANTPLLQQRLEFGELPLGGQSGRRQGLVSEQLEYQKRLQGLRTPVQEDLTDQENPAGRPSSEAERTPSKRRRVESSGTKENREPPPGVQAGTPAVKALENLQVMPAGVPARTPGGVLGSLSNFARGFTEGGKRTKLAGGAEQLHSPEKVRVKDGSQSKVDSTRKVMSLLQRWGDVGGGSPGRENTGLKQGALSRSSSHQ
eukprot:jgi/Mesen1/9411/ME000614S08662